MSMPMDWTQPTLDDAISETADLRVVHLSDQLAARSNELEVVKESLADLELAFEDRGWERLSMDANRDLSAAGRRRIRDLCRVMNIANPLIKRGLGLRAAYVWGQGVTITVRDQSDDGQDVNAVVQAFLDDPSNKKTFSGSQAREEMERSLGTDGEAAAALFTNPLTGRVQVRWVPVDEITEIISDPEDQVSHWYYRREYTAKTVTAGRLIEQTLTSFYPALGYEPRGIDRPRFIDGYPVLWDSPIRMLAVNRPSGSMRGIPDAFAAIAWARSYKEFLEQWSVLMKALARFAWQKKTRGDKVKQVAAKIASRAGTSVGSGNPDGVGATVVNTGDETLEAIPKTGATIDADSGRPLAAMAATALELPVTMLLGDPGVNGARAVAETLDQPTELGFWMRRNLWSEFQTDIINHVIDWAVRAPQGELDGSVKREGNRVLVELPDNDDRTVDISWPEFSSMPIDTLVKAIVEADTTGLLPPLVTLRTLLGALKVDNADEILNEVTDEDGTFIDRRASAGQAAADAFRRGQDPAAALNGAPDPESDSTDLAQ
ncbi:hypothetical protein ACFPJ1_40640 [Kribbella qitaiheensis]|uniref:hypothetical protein n=1 Tax=Kribbella qitaiheensis TaxID=1544730 RepID=UPI003609E779